MKTWQLDPKALGKSRRNGPIPSMWRVPVFAVAIVIAVVILLMVGARSAAATEAPFRLAAWKVEDLADVWATPQLLQADVVLEVASLDALDEVLPPGCYQLDLYLNDETTAALLLGGILYGPNNPAEHLAFDALGAGVSPWKYICIEEPTPTPTPTETVTPEPSATPTISATSTPEPALADSGIDPTAGLLLAAGALLTAAAIFLGRAVNRRRPRSWSQGNSDPLRNFDGSPRLHPDFGNNVVPIGMVDGSVLRSNFPPSFPLLPSPESARAHVNSLEVDPWAHVRERDN